MPTLEWCCKRLWIIEAAYLFILQAWTIEKVGQPAPAISERIPLVTFHVPGYYCIKNKGLCEGWL
jgi:hypothetical protein